MTDLVFSDDERTMLVRALRKEAIDHDLRGPNDPGSQRYSRDLLALAARIAGINVEAMVARHLSDIHDYRKRAS